MTTSCNAAELENCALCSSLDENLRELIARHVKRQPVKAGEIVAVEGQPGTGFFIVGSGRLRIFKATATGKSALLFIAKPGMSFGEAIFGESGLIPANAEAIEDGEVLFVPKDAILSLSRTYPEIIQRLVDILSSKLQRIYESVGGISLLSAKARVARYLLANLDGHTITLPRKKREVADELNLTPETLSRVFKGMESERLISVTRSRIQVLSVDGLRQVVEDETMRG